MITIPHDWTPRPHQLPLLQALDGGIKRAVCVWHRRAGKDNVSLNFAIKEAIRIPGVYWHMLPTAAQARKVIWDGIDNLGRRIINHAIPHAIRTHTNKSEMRIELVSGSIWQLVGSDNYDSLVGSNPRGVVFSEFSVADPMAWGYIRPILTANGGWAIFIFTPRGKNHAYDLLKMGRGNPEWFCEVLDVERTGIISPDQIDGERRAGMSQAMIQQEFFCSFDSALEGAYFGSQMDQARIDGRICKVPYDPAAPAITVWDLGVGDSTAIWIAQLVGREVRIIDYYEASGEGLAHYAKILSGKPYNFTEHWAPHDIEVRELGSGKSRRETALSYGIKFRVIPRLSVEDGIEAARNLIPRAYFDAEKCDQGIEALKSYRKTFDPKKEVWSEAPLHDWSSHAADAFRYLAIVIDQRRGSAPKPSIIHQPAVSWMG